MRLVPIVALVRDDVAQRVADTTRQRTARMGADELDTLRRLFASNGWTFEAYVAGSFVNAAFPLVNDVDGLVAE